MSSQQLTGRPVVPLAVFWLVVVLGLVVVGLIILLVVGSAV